MIPKVRKHTYYSIFAGHIQDYINLKQALGYKFLTNAQQLKLFDRFCMQKKLSEPVLTKDLVITWTAKRDGEASRTRNARFTAIKGFGSYLNSIGIIAALPPKTTNRASDNTFIPYIYTHTQVANIIHAADRQPTSQNCSMFHVVFPAILRILYGCGLRISEALVLHESDVNLEKGIITIWNSKNGNSRQLPLSSSLKTALTNYRIKMGDRISPSGFFFPNAKREQYSQRTTYDKFREILWKCKIPHKGKGGPRLHDFRHTFAVHALQKWSEEDRDCYILLPILATYLGHKNINCTEKYLRLTAEVFPDMLKKAEVLSNIMIPEVSEYEAD